MLEAKTLTKDTAQEIAEWCGGMLVEEHDAVDYSIVQPGINVPCGDEVIRASLGNTVLCKSDGTFAVIK